MVVKMSMPRAFICLAAASAVIFDITVATNFTVGSPPGGWDTTTDLQTWASSQSFTVGDNLIFQYASNHDVVEVTEADYDSCQANNPIQMYTGGTTIIPLVAFGKRYFICGTTGHCAQGMKVEVDTHFGEIIPPLLPPKATTPPPAGWDLPSPRVPESPANTLPLPPPLPPPPPPPPPPRTISVSAPPPPSSATKVKVMVGSIVGLGFVSMMVLAL